MFTNNQLAKSVRLAIAMGAAATVLPHSAIAAAEDEAAQNIEKISITGTRILREGAASPSPVTVISGEDLVSSGVVNIGEALNELPALANTYSLANSGRFIGTAGLNILDLRNMGTARTLVLVDGKRHVSSSSGTSSVDTNTIPSEWVERVEIITGGASAVYGADAVTGVVNFVLKERIEGLSVKATKGFADNHGYKNEKMSFSYGIDFDDDKGNFAISAEYASQDSLNALDNPWTSTSYASLKNPNQPADKKDSVDYPDKILHANAGHFTLNNAGVIFNTNEYHTFNTDGSLKKISTGEQVDGLRCAGAGCDFFNLNQFVQAQPEFERYNFNVRASYELAEETEAYFTAKYVNSEAQDIGQPAFFFRKKSHAIQRDNAFLHQSVKDYMDAEGVSEIQISRMMTDLGRRVEDNTRETTRFVAGVRGYMLQDWSYDFSLVHGQTDLERINGNNLIRANYANALDAVKDANGNIVCRSEKARAEGCVPVNIMGFGNPSQAAIDYINTVSIGTSEIKQTVITASVANSELIEVPEGYIGVALGAEYREEKSEDHEPENAKGTFFNALGEDKGEFDVSEVFAEFTAPIVEGLMADAAIRFADYSTIGNATSWKVGTDWEVNESLRMRATYSEALRAPNISEIFGAASQTFFRIDDPCKSSELDLLANADTRKKNCAALGVAADFDSDYDSGSIEGLSGGNKDLNEEKAETTTIGLVFQPEYIDGFSMTLDYWKIELTDAISSVGAQSILDRCVDSENGINNQYCNLITRGSNGEITLIKSFDLNLAGQKARGVDFEFGYDFDALAGSFRTTLVGTRLLERKSFPFQDNPSDFIENAGTTGEAKWQANLTVGYSRDNYSVSWSTRYLEEVSRYTPQDLEDNPNPSNILTFPSYVISDVSASYEMNNGIELTIGIDNVFNKSLPFGTNGTGAGTASYDNIGRLAHITFSYKM